MRSRFSTKYFPFSPGIPWTIKYSKYIVPEVPGSIVLSNLKDKNIIVAAYSGFLESFFSLVLCEMMNYMLPSSKLLWAGDDRFGSLIKINGLAKLYNGDVDQSVLDRYPVPLFFDKENNAYFNCLNNYIDVKTYYTTHGYFDSRAAVKQIIEKSLFDWDIRYMPKLRNLYRDHSKLRSKLDVSKISEERPFVLLLPDTDWSVHNEDCLGWTPTQIKSFGALLSQENIPLIVLTKNPSKYFYSFVTVLPMEMELLLYLIMKAKYILSSTIDFLLVGGAISDATIISRPVSGEFKLSKNIRYLEGKNVIYTIEEIFPTKVYSYISGN